MALGLGFYKADESALDELIEWCEESNTPWPHEVRLGDRLLVPDHSTLSRLIKSVEAFKESRKYKRNYWKTIQGQWIFNFLPELYRLQDHQVQPVELTKSKEARIDHRSLRDEYIAEIKRHKERRPQITLKELRTLVMRGLKLKEHCPSGLLAEYRKDADTELEKIAAPPPKSSVKSISIEQNEQAGKDAELEDLILTLSYADREEVGPFLRAVTPQLKKKQRRGVEGTIADGKTFLEVKNRLSPARYRRWLRLLGISASTAYECERCAEVFGNDDLAVLKNFEVSALYTLSRKSETHSKAVPEARELAKKGEFITRAVASQLVENNKLSTGTQNTPPLLCGQKTDKPAILVETNRSSPPSDHDQIEDAGHLLTKLWDPTKIAVLAAEHPNVLKKDVATLIDILARWASLCEVSNK